MTTAIIMVDYNNPISLSNYYRDKNSYSQITNNNSEKSIVKDFEKENLIVEEITYEKSRKLIQDAA